MNKEVTIDLEYFKTLIHKASTFEAIMKELYYVLNESWLNYTNNDLNFDDGDLKRIIKTFLPDHYNYHLEELIDKKKENKENV